MASGKLAQAIAYGAQIITLDGNFDEAFDLVKKLAANHPVTLVNSVNPHRLEGQKTAAFEIVDVLGDAPDFLFIPVGNAGNIAAYWMGFCQYHDLGKTTGRPRMMGFQAEGAAPIVRGVPVTSPTTVASAIRIGNPASWQLALAARDESEGRIDMVSDEEILSAYRLMASREGIFCEPASAASVAGLIKMAGSGLDIVGKRVVCVITGTGLKEPEMASQQTSAPPIQIAADLRTVEDALGLVATH